MVTPICEEPLCRIICIFSPPPPSATACISPPLITAPQMKGVLFDSVLIIQLQYNNSTLQDYKKKCSLYPNLSRPPCNPKWFWMGENMKVHIGIKSACHWVLLRLMQPL